MFEISSIEPATIFAEIDSQPPLMRRRVATAYLGREICWSLIFSDASEPREGRTRLLFDFDPHSVKMIVGEVLLSNYPSLMHAKSGESVLVRGRVKSVDKICIELEIQALILSRSTEQPTEAGN